MNSGTVTDARSVLARPLFPVVAVILLLLPQAVHVQESPTPSFVEPRPGFVANRVAFGDPVQVVVVAGFAEEKAAAAFVAAGLTGNSRPSFEQKLAPGQSVRFADAARPGEPAVLVFYYLNEHGQRTLLSMTRAHASVPLAIRSYGFQFLLDVDRSTPP